MYEILYDDPFKFLVYRKFPELVELAQKVNGLGGAQLLHSEIEHMPILKTHDWPLLPIEAQQYLDDLKTKDQVEINEVFQREFKKKLIEDDSALFFNQESANADFDYWSKMPGWTIDEAVALTFGKNPEIVNKERLDKLNASLFAEQYAEKRELVSRSRDAGLFTDGIFVMFDDLIIPHKYVRWVQANRIEFPPELAQKVIDTLEANNPLQTDYKKILESSKINSNRENGKRMDRSLLERDKKLQETKQTRKKEATTSVPTKFQNDQKKASAKQKSADLNIIGALLGLLLGESSNGIKYSQFESQQSIIDAIHANFGKEHGLSQRNLEDKFSKAKDKLKSSG